uniref:Alpha-1,3-mannosyl-glycoprotein 2-beta-N-acetylglucosaminyltransferase n=1 Tax=Eptatretus burgeri TaxID=7764 RepID=A0A8C4NB92_EPTBU
MRRSCRIFIFAVFASHLALLLFLFSRAGSPSAATFPEQHLLSNSFSHLTSHLELELQQQKRILDMLRPITNRTSKPRQKFPRADAGVAILVVACDRPSISRCLDSLLHSRQELVARGRDSESRILSRFPIFVSLGCNNRPTAQMIIRYKDKVTLLQAPEEVTQFEPKLPPTQKKLTGYYRIATHYKWALQQIFNVMEYEAAVVVEDDLEVSPDFLEYFLATLPLLSTDSSLLCASAWSDNGRPELVEVSRPDLLHRTDFFPGLGWLLRQELWQELEPVWPKAFWDDWLREPAQRKGRQCLRPEVPRSETFGRSGVSQGQFFDRHLRYVRRWRGYVSFSTLALDYLEPKRYAQEMEQRLMAAKEVSSLSELETVAQQDGNEELVLRLSGQNNLAGAVRALGIMGDLKANIARNSYRGLIPLMYRGRRLYLIYQKPSDS